MMFTARFLAVSFCAAVVSASCFAPVAAWAQPPAAAPPSANPAPVPADVQKAYLDIADLSLLRALIPVKLKADQIDKILAQLQPIRAEGTKRRQSDEAALRAVAVEVAKARDAALTQNTPVPPETEAKIVKLFDEADKRFASAKKAAIDRVLPVLQVNLTSEQRGTIKTYVENKMLDGKKFSPKAKPDAVENAALELYIERVLLDERSIEVLTRLRAGSSASAPPPATPTPPPATAASAP